MIPSTTTIERITNMVGEESIAMSIDTDSLAFLMSTLSNLYSDNELAVLRELSTNARDAMIAAGKADRPIEVMLPNAFRQSLVIKDTGLGMDIDDLRNTYSKYGASSKRESNDYNGVLGLGSKSPFTITDSYTVRAVKNGVKTAVNVSRSEEGGGTMEVIAQTPVTEENSVEITIPTARRNRFSELAKNLFKFWGPGTVLVDGVEPQRFEAVKMSDKIYVDFNKSSYYDEDMVIMGGVAYPFGENVNRYYRTYYFADNGEVEFAPSREALKMTPKTRAVLAEVRNVAPGLVREYITEEMKKLSDVKEVVQFMDGKYDLLSTLGLVKYKNQIYRGSHTPGGKFLSYAGDIASRITSVNIAVAYKQDRVIVISDRERLSTTQKNKLDQYARDKGLSGRYYIIPWYWNNYFLSGLKEAKWDDIMATKVTTVNPNAGVKRGPLAEYQVLVSNFFNSSGKLDPKSPIYYALASEMTNDVIVNNGARIKRHVPGAQIARVYKVKEKAFKAAFPNAKHVYDGLEEIANDSMKYVNDTDFLQFLSIQNDFYNLEQIAQSHYGVLDPRFLSDYTRFKRVQNFYEKIREGSYANANLPADRRKEHKNWVVDAVAYRSPMQDYPLVKHAMNYGNMSDIIEYINLLYTKREENK